MTKNKKKLRRVERRYSVTKSAQTLVLAGMLLAGGVSGAMATETSVKDTTEWGTAITTGTALQEGNALKVTGTTGNTAVVAGNDATSLGSLIILSQDSSNAAALTVNSNLSFAQAISITGVSSGTGTLTINAGKTLTSGTKTTVADYAKLDITGTHIGVIEATGGNSSLIDLTGTQKGDVTLNGAGVTLESKADTAEVWGNITVTNGTLTTANNALTIYNADKSGLGNVTLGANSTLTLATTAGDVLTLGTLKADKDTAIAGLLKIESLDATGTGKLTLNNGGSISFKDFADNSTNATLYKDAAAGKLNLGTGGSLTAAELTLIGFDDTDAVSTTTNDLALKADKLILDKATTFGAASGSGETKVTIRAAGSTSVTDFINHDITIKGYASNEGTLQLGTDDSTNDPSNSVRTTKNITLLGNSAAGDASLKVDYGNFEVGTVNVGSADGATAADKGQIIVGGGTASNDNLFSTLTANTINLYGDATGDALLDIKGVASQTNTVNVDTLNVGGTATYGKVVVGDASNGTAVLNVTNLNLDSSKGQVNVNATGTLNIANNYEIDDANLVAFSSAADGKLAVGGTLDVDGTLTLSNAGATATGLVTGGTVNTNVIAAEKSGGTPVLSALAWNGGTLNLRGNADGKFIDATEFSVTGGTVNLGIAAENGGTYANKVTANGGTLNVAKGEWTLSDTVDGLIVKTATGVTVNGGTLNVAKWDSKTTSAGTATVQNGKLNLTGTTSGSIKTDSATDIAVSNAGAVTANYDAVFTNDKTLIANTVSQFTVTDTGVLTIKDRADKNITLAAYKTLKTAVMGTGTGTLRLDGVQITDVPADAKLADVAGVSVPDFVATLDSTASNNNITGYGTEVKGLKAAGTADTTVAITGGLTLVGGEKDFKLSDNGDKKTNFTVGSGALLMLGSAAGDKTYGTLTGDIELNDATAKFTATNGDFTVGDIVGSATGTIITNNSNLTAGAIGTSTVAQDVELKSSGSLTATKASFANKVTLVGESFSTTAGNDLTVKGAVDITNGTLSSGKDLDLSTSATIAALNGADLKAVNAIKAGALALTAGENGLGISAKTFTSTGALTSTGDNGPLLVNITETLTAASITADSTNTKNSQISAGNMVISGAVALDNNTVLVSTDAAKANTIGGALTLGTTPDADADIAGSTAHMQVDGSLKVTQNTTLLNGSTLSVGEFISTAGTTVTVGNADDSKGSSLIIDKLTGDATTASIFFVDPGTDTSFMQIKSMTDGKLNDIAIGSNNSIVSFGEHNETWSKAQIAESGFKPTATLVMATPIEMGATGQILMGDQYEDDGVWDIANNPGASADTYGLALRGDTLVIADMSKADGVTPGIKLNAAHSNVLIENSVGVRLYADKLQANQNALLVNGIGQLEQEAGTAINSGTLDVKHANTTNMLIGIGDIIYDKGTTANSGTLSASTYAKKASSMLPNISGSMGSYLEHMAVTPGFDTASDNMGIKFVSRALDNRFIGTNNAEQAAATIEGAAQLAVVGAAPAMTLSAVQAGTSTVTTRTSFASPLMDSSKAVALHKDVDGTLSVDSGLNAGNGMKNGFGLWIMPLYQSNSAWGMKADGFKGGYKSDLGGVALGADYTFNDMFRLGLAFNIGGGYAESNGDFNKTENSFNFWGINAYGGWTMNNFGITADVGYTGNYNKLEQELPGAMGMSDIKSDVNSSAWTAGLRGEYKFATEALDIIPHVGVRYTGLTTDEYKAKSGGDTVFKVDQDFQSIWTFPIGVTLAKEIETGSGWIIRPQVDLGITPATGDVKAKSKTRIPGVDGSAEMKMQVVDYMSYDGGVGLEMKKDNVSFGINYNIQASEHRTGHGVFGTFRYEF